MFSQTINLTNSKNDTRPIYCNTVMNLVNKWGDLKILIHEKCNSKLIISQINNLKSLKYTATRVLECAHILR